MNKNIKLHHFFKKGGRVKEGNNSIEPLSGLRILDVGCGAGLLSEPLARLGAEVVGIDAAEENIECAKQHASNDPIGILK